MVIAERYMRNWILVHAARFTAHKQNGLGQSDTADGVFGGIRVYGRFVATLVQIIDYIYDARRRIIDVKPSFFPCFDIV